MGEKVVWIQVKVIVRKTQVRSTSLPGEVLLNTVRPSVITDFNRSIAHANHGLHCPGISHLLTGLGACGLTGRETSGTPRAAGAPAARRDEHGASAATSERSEDVRSIEL